LRKLGGALTYPVEEIGRSTHLSCWGIWAENSPILLREGRSTHLSCWGRGGALTYPVEGGTEHSPILLRDGRSSVTLSLQAPGGMAVMWACPSPRLGRVNSPDTRRQLEGAESPSHSGQEDRALSELLTTCNNTFFNSVSFLTTCNNKFLTVFLCSPPAKIHF
jgi:hypothetical protein